MSISFDQSDLGKILMLKLSRTKVCRHLIQCATIFKVCGNTILAEPNLIRIDGTVVDEDICPAYGHMVGVGAGDGEVVDFLVGGGPFGDGAYLDVGSGAGA